MCNSSHRFPHIRFVAYTRDTVFSDCRAASTRALALADARARERARSRLNERRPRACESICRGCALYCYYLFQTGPQLTSHPYPRSSSVPGETARYDIFSPTIFKSGRDKPFSKSPLKISYSTAKYHIDAILASRKKSQTSCNQFWSRETVDRFQLIQLRLTSLASVR